MMRSLVVTALLLGSVLPAIGASDEAWGQFRADVEAACLAAAEPMFETAVIRVDPFGSQSYGLALVTGKAMGAETGITAICVYDKKTKAAEIGGELPAP